MGGYIFCAVLLIAAGLLFWKGSNDWDNEEEL